MPDVLELCNPSLSQNPNNQYLPIDLSEICPVSTWSFVGSPKSCQTQSDDLIDALEAAKLFPIDASRQIYNNAVIWNDDHEVQVGLYVDDQNQVHWIEGNQQGNFDAVRILDDMVSQSALEYLDCYEITETFLGAVNFSNQ